jgi:Na+-driven multidrug efflux pump
LIRTLVLVIPVVWVFGVVIYNTLEGVWKGLVFANMAGAIMAFSWAQWYLRRLIKGKYKDDLTHRVDTHGQN